MKFILFDWWEIKRLLLKRDWPDRFDWSNDAYQRLNDTDFPISEKCRRTDQKKSPLINLAVKEYAISKRTQDSN